MMSLKDILKEYGIPEDIEGSCGIQDIKAKFVSYVARVQYVNDIPPNRGAYILVNPSFIEDAKKIEGNTYIETEDATKAFLEIHNTLHKDVRSLSTGAHRPKAGDGCEIDPTARFGENVLLGERVRIHPYAIIGSDVVIGDDTEVLSHSVIYDRVTLGKRNFIDSNASVGGDGFRIIRDAKGINQRLIHIGGVLFGDDVEFGNSSCVDRGSFGDTILEDNVKVDNMVHIGHNARIKKNAQLAASSCIGGSTVIGENCWVGIGATISNGLVIGDNASVLINAVVTLDVNPGDRVAGVYAMNNTAWIALIKDHAKHYGAQIKKPEEE